MHTTKTFLAHLLAEKQNFQTNWQFFGSEKGAISINIHFFQTQMINYNGYPAEEYNVTTDDGYILTIQRIPHGRQESYCSGPRPVILVQHGLLCSSSNWVSNLPNESFGFILADKGFDVWLGNVRGNTYGLHHVNFSVDSDAFWDFR